MILVGVLDHAGGEPPAGVGYGTESPLLYGAPAECPEAADPPPLRGYVSSAARARPSTTVRALQPSVRNLWIVLSFVSDLSIHGCWQAAVGGALPRHAPAILHPQERY